MISYSSNNRSFPLSRPIVLNREQGLSCLNVCHYGHFISVSGQIIYYDRYLFKTVFFIDFKFFVVAYPHFDTSALH